MSTRELSARQKRFCVNVATGMSQSDAYRLAGYPGQDVATLASRLLSANHNVKAYLNQLIERQAESASDRYTEMIMAPAEVKARLSQLARSSLATILDDDGDIQVSKDTVDIEAVRSLSVKRTTDRDGSSSDTTAVKLVNPIEPLRELSKILGLYAPARTINAHKIQFDITIDDKSRPPDKPLRLDTGSAAAQLNA